MGSCVSTHKNQDPATKIPPPSIDSKPPSHLISTPTNENRTIAKQPISQFHSSSASQDFGSKEDAFFDTHAWLESDGDDDFLSVNGDLTPSSGSSPNHHRRSSSLGTPRLKKSPLMDRPRPNSKPELSPSDNKTRLSELLMESEGGEPAAQNAQNAGHLQSNQTQVQFPSESSEGIPKSDERNPIRDSKQENIKSGKTSQCCLPSLVHSIGCNDKKK